MDKEDYSNLDLVCTMLDDNMSEETKEKIDKLLIGKCFKLDQGIFCPNYPEVFKVIGVEIYTPLKLHTLCLNLDSIKLKSIKPFGKIINDSNYLGYEEVMLIDFKEYMLDLYGIFKTY